MVGQFPLVAALPTSAVDMTADFAPLLIGLWVVVGLCVLGLTTIVALQDTQEAQRTATQGRDADLSLPKAA